MRAGINSAGQAAGDYQAPFGQIPRQPLRHLIPVRGRTTRADDRNHVAIQKFNVSANIQEGRRIVNLAQPLRVFRFVPREQTAACGLGLSQLLRGSAQGLARMDGLRDGGRQALGFQRGQRGVENRVGAAEFAQQFSGHARAQAGRQRKRQPSQVLVGGH